MKNTGKNKFKFIIFDMQNFKINYEEPKTSNFFQIRYKKEQTLKIELFFIIYIIYRISLFLNWKFKCGIFIKSKKIFVKTNSENSSNVQFVLFKINIL